MSIFVGDMNFLPFRGRTSPILYVLPARAKMWNSRKSLTQDEIQRNFEEEDDLDPDDIVSSDEDDIGDINPWRRFRQGR
jgi:hypothetical protein